MPGSYLDMEILSAKEMGIEIPVEENGATFEENAILKAKAIAEACTSFAPVADFVFFIVGKFGARPA